MQGQTVKLKNLIAGLWGKVQKKAFLVFWLILVIVFAFEILVIRGALGIIIKPAGEPLTVKKSKGVRLDFTGYNNVVERMDTANSFKAEIKVIDNPFGVK